MRENNRKKRNGKRGGEMKTQGIFLNVVVEYYCLKNNNKTTKEE